MKGYIMIYIYGHSPSSHPNELDDKEMVLKYLTEWLPDHFHYRTTYNITQVESIIFSFQGELIAELVVDRVIPPTAKDLERYDKARKVCLIKEIRLFKDKSYRIKDFPTLKQAQHGTKVPEEVYREIIEAVGDFERIIRRPGLTLNYGLLAGYFRAFVRYVEKKDEKPFISFAGSDYLDKEENYKGWLNLKARNLLNSKDWRRSQIGSGKIIDRVIAAIEVEDENYPNNLLVHDLRYGEKGRNHQSLYDAKKQPALCRQYETLLYNFFHKEIDDRAAFREFIAVAGRKYAYLAYLYFLKDRSLYLPIAPRTFDKAFDMLGIDFSTEGQCAWENYQTYNGLITEIRDFLAEQLPTEVTLLDAHSFLWIMARPPQLSIEEEEEVEVEYEGFIPIAGPGSKPPTPIGKADYLAKHRQQIKRGQRAEEIVVHWEKEKLRSNGRPDLAEQVRPAANDADGYDILSYDLQGEEMRIEVKALREEAGRRVFFLTRNEYAKSKTLKNYYLYLVTNLKGKPKILGVKGPDFSDNSRFNCEVETYRVSIE
jgi:hypothetical protein